MKNVLLFSTVALVGVILAPCAIAQDSEPRPALKCLPMESLAKLSDKLSSIPEKHRDIIKPSLNASIEDSDGHGFPERIYFKDGDKETDLKIDPDGKLIGVSLDTPMSKTTELCLYDPERAALAKDEARLGLSFSVDIAYPKKAKYDLDELEEGLDEGRVHYKKMMPGPVSLLVPKLTHVIVGYEKKNSDPKIYAMQGEERLDGLDMEPFGYAWIIDVKALKKLGADHLSIEDNFEMIEPGASGDTLRKLGFKEEGESEE